MRRITAGFSPTIDCAVLVAAAEKGFAADEGLSLSLVRKTTARAVMASLDDGEIEAAHLPAALPVAAALGVPDAGGRGIAGALIVPFVLALGGATLTVSAALLRRLQEEGFKVPDPASAARAFARVAAARRAQGERLLAFGVEHLLSGSAFELQYLLASAMLRARRDFELVERPPKDMPECLEDGDIDGFYTAEPYGSEAVLHGTGSIVTTKSHIWQNAPEKVLAVPRAFAEHNAATLENLMRALYRAAQWCAGSGNIEELAGILAAPHYLGVEGELVLPALTGFVPHSRGRLLERPGFLAFSGRAANFPWQSQALWFFEQMLRWGDCPAERAGDADAIKAAAETYRPDLFRKAMRPLFAPVPSADMKMEGTLTAPVQVGASRSGLVLGPDAFFDGRIFDPERIERYDDI